MTFMNRYALHFLVGLNLLLGLLLASMWFDTHGRSRNLNWQTPAPQTTDYAAMLPQIPDAMPMNTGAIMALLERPLFSITRRPPPPPPPPKAADAPPPDTLSTARLIGLYAGPDQSGIILHIGGKNRRLRIREQVEGWTLSAIDQRSATFSSGSSQRTLPLLKGNLSKFTGEALADVPPPQTANAPTAAPSPPDSPAPVVTSPPVQTNASPPAPSGPGSTGGAKPRPQPVFGGSIR